MKKLYILIYFIVSVFGSSALASQSPSSPKFLALIKARSDKEKNDKEHIAQSSAQSPKVITKEEQCAKTFLKSLDDIIFNLSLASFFGTKFDNTTCRDQCLAHAKKAQSLFPKLEEFLGDETNSLMLSSMDLADQQKLEGMFQRIVQLQIRLEALLANNRPVDTDNFENDTTKDVAETINVISQFLKNRGLISEDPSPCDTPIVS